MKTISAPAMAAIEAGEALVTGAVEIIPLGLLTFGMLGAVNVVGTDFGGSFAARSTVFTGFAAADGFRVSKPAVADDPRLSWDAWSAWPADDSTGPGTVPVIGQTWTDAFSVYGNNGGADVLLFAPVLDPDLYATEADAYAALAPQLPVTLTGYSTYKVVAPFDNNPPDNRHGMSLLVEHGVAVGSAPPLYVWGGYQPIDLDTDFGTETFQPIGASGLIQQNSGAVGGVAQGLSLALSGIEPKLLSLMDDGDQYKGAAAVIHRLIFANDGKTLLDSSVWDRGRLDTIQSDETVGKDATLTAAVESAARSLGRSGARMRADSDQRLISAVDGYFKFTSYAGEKKSYWGGKIPSTVG